MSDLQTTKSDNGKKSPGAVNAAGPGTTAPKRPKKKAVRLKDVANGSAGVRWMPRHSNRILDRVSAAIALVPAANRPLVIAQAIEMLKADLEGGEVVVSAASVAPTAA